MKHPYLIDLNDEANWLYPIELFGPDGVKHEDQRTINNGIGPHKLFCVTDSLMYKSNPEHTHFHEHLIGYEIFFIDSGGLNFYANSQKSYVEPGSILFIQPYEAHYMQFTADTKFRGFFHDLRNSDNSPELAILRKNRPALAADPNFFREHALGGHDSQMREPLVCEEVPVEKMTTVRHIDRPIASFDLGGATMKMITGRWENGGVCEMWAIEMQPGFQVEWDQFPTEPEMYYVTKGEVKFKIYDEEFVATPECVVKVPKFAEHSIEALTDSVMYDVGGLTRWYAFLQDRASIMKYDPERAKLPETIAELKRKYGCNVKSFGLK